jgi:hypothetical protein
MPEFRINMRVKQKGVLFDKAKTKAAAQRAVIRVNEAIADETVIRIKTRLDKVLQNPTGYYRSNIQRINRSIYRGVSDGGVVYGGYLEGVAKNNKTTRFKGYWTFRTVRQEINRDKGKIAAPVVRRLAGELNA